MPKPFFWSIIALNLIAILVALGGIYVIKRASTKPASVAASPTMAIPEVADDIFGDGRILKSSITLADKTFSVILSVSLLNIILLSSGVWSYRHHNHG